MQGIDENRIWATNGLINPFVANIEMEKDMAISLEKMSRKELLELRGQVETAIKSAEKRERKEALKAAEKAAAEYGFSLSELSEGAAKPAKSAKSSAKYKNPANPDQTWSGRGRKPQWVHDALNAGADISDLEI
jgi:DNA-binding protein H-NS